MGKSFSEVGWEKDAWDVEGGGGPVLLLHSVVGVKLRERPRAVESVRVQVPLQQLEADAVSHGRSEGKGLVVVDGSEKAMVGSGLQKAVEGNGDGKQANCNRRCLGGVSCKGTRSGAAGGLKNLGFQGLKEAQVVQGFSSKAAHLCSGPLEGSKVLKSKEACGVGHLAKKAHRLPALLCGPRWRGHYFQNRKLFPPVELHTSTDMALMEEAARHPGSFSFSVSPLGTRAASSPSFCGTDLGRRDVGWFLLG
ncbi:hypothetical protein CK203_005893 [Vitis vinifera]|uniref:Uncharacterized protein n=1 Tax=Vitis vinifera TaxID=29760 RepID=A0A438K5I3_VITVI|nr:hypothetical protein CK203_005893 [Vitis vinifera]